MSAPAAPPDRLTVHCRRCQAHLADLAGPGALRFGNAIVPIPGRSLLIICGPCLKKFRWFRVDKSDEPCSRWVG